MTNLETVFNLSVNKGLVTLDDRFGVYDDNGKLLGQRILPFDDLQVQTISLIVLFWNTLEPFPAPSLPTHFSYDRMLSIRLGIVT